MKRMSLLLYTLLFTNLFFAQDRTIKITNPAAVKEIFIKENKRIKIITTAGQKLSGRFRIVDANTIFISNLPIALTEIASMKRNPLLLSIFTSGFFVYTGAITAGFGLIIGAFVQSSGYLLTLPAAGMIYTGIKSPNFNRKFKRDKNWTYEIMTVHQ